MIVAICKEMSLSKSFIENSKINTVYFGGGTPSLLSAAELQMLFDALYKNFSVSNDAEITLEANPDDINPLMLRIIQDIGVNRLSIGLQSFNEAELKWMNRAHNSSQSLQCLEDVKNAGFTDYSVDLIFGSPLQSNDDLKNNFEIIANKNVPHISCYALTVEPGTALSNLIIKNKTPAADPDEQAEQFEILLKLAAAKGYDHYELSNFAKPGHRSRHNSSYWQGEPYYGFGPAAHSFNGSHIRRWNVSNNALYIQSLEKNIIPFEEELLSDNQRLNEYVMTSLRTSEGLDLNVVSKNYGKHESERIRKEANAFLSDKKMIEVDHFLILTAEGKFLADGIAAALFAATD